MIALSNVRFRFSFLLLLLWALMCISCASSKVVQFLNEDMDFGKYETYRVVDSKLSKEEYSIQGALFFETLENELHLNMDKRLYTQAQASDLLVEYEIVSSERTETPRNNAYNPYYLNSLNPSLTTRHYKEGILIIEIRDRVKKKLIWQASIDLKYTKSTELTDLITEAVDEIFATYPYLAGSDKNMIEE